MHKLAKQGNKVVVIGLDGLTMDIVEPWALDGTLPNINHLLKTGTFGRLKSTHPPISAPAWASFMTGQNPGKHGLFDFQTLSEDRRYLLPVNSSTIKSLTIWDIFNEHYKRVCAINIPMTYPPFKVNGAMVSGMFIPSIDSPFVYPEEERKNK